MRAKGRARLAVDANGDGLAATLAAAREAGDEMLGEVADAATLAQSAANSLGGAGVRVDAICLGLIETGMTRLIFDRARERGSAHKIGQLNPLERAGQPEETAL